MKVLHQITKKSNSGVGAAMDNALSKENKSAYGDWYVGQNGQPTNTILTEVEVTPNVDQYLQPWSNHAAIDYERRTGRPLSRYKGSSYLENPSIDIDHAPWRDPNVEKLIQDEYQKYLYELSHYGTPQHARFHHPFGMIKKDYEDRVKEDSVNFTNNRIDYYSQLPKRSLHDPELEEAEIAESMHPSRYMIKPAYSPRTYPFFRNQIFAQGYRNGMVPEYDDFARFYNQTNKVEGWNGLPAEDSSLDTDLPYYNVYDYRSDGDDMYVVPLTNFRYVDIDPYSFAKRKSMEITRQYTDQIDRHNQKQEEIEQNGGKPRYLRYPGYKNGGLIQRRKI